MKNIFIISILIYLLNPLYLYANDSVDCSFQDTAETIVNYISDDKKILGNIISNLGNSNNDTSTIEGKINTDAISKIKGKFIKMSNSIFNWNGYESYFRFYVTLPLSPLEQEVPYEILRDHKILQNEGKTLNQLAEKLVKNGNDGSNIDINDLCEGVSKEESCKSLINGNTNVIDIINKLLENNLNIQNFYRLSVLDSFNDFKGDLYMIDANEIKEKYNQARISSYSQNCGFAKRGMDKMKEIFNWQKVTKEGLHQWNDALLRLRCSGVTAAGVCSPEDSAKYKDLEKKLLKNELQRQGLSANMTQKMLGNLENFNKCSEKAENKDNIFAAVSCGAKQVLEQSAKAIYNWDSQKGKDGGFIQNFLSTAEGLIKNGFGKTENVSIKDLENTDNISDKNDAIRIKIKELHLLGKNTIAQKADEEDKMQARMIDIHANLVDAIEKLNKTQEKSKEVCNKQISGEGTCDTN